MDYGFFQPFQLQADPKQQDQWTTFVEWEKLVEARVVGPLDTCDDVGSTEAKAMRLREFHEAAFAVRVRSSTAATGTTTTTTARKTSTTNARGKRPAARRGQTPPTHTPKSLQSAQIHLDNITRRNKLVDEYLHNTKKYRSVKAEADHQQRRVEWVIFEINKIEAEQKAAGKGSGSGGTGRRKRKRTSSMHGSENSGGRMRRGRR
ncbi:hypothetical protein B0T09DRAFT_67887 [Sordaria sp. MPI-SDFR-AT-0083]|nr:hypothetical protein B0T09DRAFT_67887 [Sordaria sp. MPI-SDFR-AT-0083]